MASALGKLIDHTMTTTSIRWLFGLPDGVSEIAVIFWAVTEAFLGIIVWRKQIMWIMLAVPPALLGVLTFSYWRGINCGCFGSLPFLSQVSFSEHLLLLGGMFLGLYYLKVSPTAKSESTEWRGKAALVMILLAFATMPFRFYNTYATDFSDSKTVDRIFVLNMLRSRSAVLIDARPEFQYTLAHLPEAINIPYDSVNLVNLIDEYSLKNQNLVVYCSSAHCNTAALLSERLLNLGCGKVRIYAGGWEDWVSNKPTQLVK